MTIRGGERERVDHKGRRGGEERGRELTIRGGERERVDHKGRRGGERELERVGERGRGQEPMPIRVYQSKDFRGKCSTRHCSASP